MIENEDRAKRVTLPFDGICEIKSITTRESRLYGIILCVEMETLAPVAGKTTTWALKLSNPVYAKKAILSLALAPGGRRCRSNLTLVELCC